MTPLPILALIGGLTAAPPPKPLPPETWEQARDRRAREFVMVARENREVLGSGTHEEKVKVRSKMQALHKELNLGVLFPYETECHFLDAINTYNALGGQPRTQKGVLVERPLEFLDKSLDAIELKMFGKRKSP